MNNGKNPEFISGALNTKRIGEILEGSTNLCLAVAFWGEDGISLFERSIKKFPKRTIKIICNFTSGATNPRFIKFCLEHQKQIQIKNNSKLHSKVLFSPECYVVGSANISSNGLGYEGNETTGWIESSMTGTELEILEDIKKWFNQEWKNAEEITEEMIDKAEKDWKKKRNNRTFLKNKKNGRAESKYLLDAVLENPQAFKDKNIYLAIYKSDLSKEAIKASDNYEKNEAEGLDPRRDWENISENAYYEDCKIPENSYLIDIYFRANGEIEEPDLIYIPNHPHIINFERDDYKKSDTGTLIVGRVVDEIEGYKKFCNPKMLSENIQELFDLGEGDEVGRLTDMTKVYKVFNKRKNRKA